MNFRSCKYFLTVCEMGTINAAARKLYISQQSLSQHIRRMEEELGAQLFHRDNPLVLTEEGKCVQRGARAVLEAMQKMEEEIAACRGAVPRELTIGLLDYGTPEFLPPIIDLFLKKEPDVLLRTREILPESVLPAEIPLYISARELGGYKSEAILTDRPGVCVTDELLKRVYGGQWQERKERLRQGELGALEGCPFVRHRNTPLQLLQDRAAALNEFVPDYLPVMGSIGALTLMCTSGQAAMISLMGHTRQEHAALPCYPIRGMTEDFPTAFVCYRMDSTLSGPAQKFLEITRRYFKKMQRGTQRHG